MSTNKPTGIVWHDDQQPHAMYPTMSDPDGVYPYRCTGCNGIVYEGACEHCANYSQQNTSWRQRGVDDFGKYPEDRTSYGRRRYR